MAKRLTSTLPGPERRNEAPAALGAWWGFRSIWTEGCLK
jgi:hypothetical protein